MLTTYKTAKKPQLKKRMIIMLICVGTLFGLIALYNLIVLSVLHHYMEAYKNPTVTVSTMKTEYSLWQPKLKYASSLRAIQGVNVTTELAAMVQTIYFQPGAFVKKDTVLVQLNADSDVAQLHSLEANEGLSQTTYDRDKAQYAIKAISKETLDTDAANLKSLQAQVAQQAATVAKKTIVAPFTGRLGISAVNPGQYINTGDTIVPLQQLDPIYTDFYVPQQALMQLKVGQPINLTTDAVPNKVFSGKITTINPVFDSTTRNVEIEATLRNPTYELVPGMFGSVEVLTGKPQPYLTLPQTAISFNPYGNIVYVVKQEGTDAKGPILTVDQVFVVTGDTRGDQITVLQGLKEGDVVVTSGQLKLKNGSRVTINNSVVPSNNANPNLSNEH